MKTVDELGISPIPWELLDDEPTVVTKLDEDVYGVVAECRDDANARLIAATPELYVCLCDAVTDFCKDCTHKTNCHDFFIPCPAKKWRRALAKAGGEGVE